MNDACHCLKRLSFDDVIMLRSVGKDFLSLSLSSSSPCDSIYQSIADGPKKGTRVLNFLSSTQLPRKRKNPCGDLNPMETMENERDLP